MKKILCLLSPVLLCSASAFAQGINFETGDWQSVVTKAKAEHKLIYLDVYTTWCGPCKMLATRIFPQKEAGDKFNALFVNYRIDAEKGEGLDIAKKYQVSGYPTNLFIEPEKQAVVFRTMGASAEVKDFVAEGDKAVAEYKDPMTLDKYQTAFKEGKRDKAFLKAYLEKNERLGHNNDEVLNAYVAILPKGNLDSTDLLYLADRVKTANNNALPRIYKQKADLQRYMATTNPDYLNNKMERVVYDTYQAAVDAKNEKLLAVAIAARKQYAPFMDERIEYWMSSQYYTNTGNKEKAFTAGIAEADFICTRSLADYARQDKAKQAEARKSVRAQLQMMKVEDSKLDSLVDLNMKNPRTLYQASFLDGSTLNDIAWQVYEGHRSDKALMAKALTWSKMSEQLSRNIPEAWAPSADTYAHLLYVSGEKDKAIAMQQSVVSKLKEKNSGDTASYETALKQMQEGTL